MNPKYIKTYLEEYAKLFHELEETKKQLTEANNQIRKLDNNLNYGTLDPNTILNINNQTDIRTVVEALKGSSSKIKGIKLIKTIFNLDLKEAKDFYEMHIEMKYLR